MPVQIRCSSLYEATRTTVGHGISRARHLSTKNGDRFFDLSFPLNKPRNIYRIQVEIKYANFGILSAACANAVIRLGGHDSQSFPAPFPVEQLGDSTYHVAANLPAAELIGW